MALEARGGGLEAFVCKLLASHPRYMLMLQGWVCCTTEIEVADQTLYLTQSQYAVNGPTGTSVDPITSSKV